MARIKLIITAFKNQKMKFLLIFMVTFVTLLIFNISSSLEDSVMTTRLNQMRDLTYNTQIVVCSEDSTLSTFDEQEFFKFFSKEKNDYIQDQITRDYCIVVETNTQEKMLLNGTDVKHQDEIYKFTLADGDIANWKCTDVMITNKFAKDHGISIGDTLVIQSNDKTEQMNVKAIAEDKGMFKKAHNTAITSEEFLDQFEERNGLINRIEITLKELKDMDTIAKEMNEKLFGTGLTAEAKYSMSYFNSYVTTVVLALNLFSIFLLLLSVYMLYSLFQSYVYENVGQMATLRSIGVSIGQYRQILCLQAGFIILLAFVFSLLCTPFAIKIMGRMVFEQVTGVTLHYGSILLKGAGVLIIAVASIYIASYKVSKTPLVSVIRNNMSHQKQKIDWKRLVVAFIVLLTTILCTYLNRNENNLKMNYVILIGVIITFLLLQQVGIFLYGTLLQKLFCRMKKEIGLFGKQVKLTLIAYLPAITTLVLVLSVSVSIFSIEDILDQALDKMYNGADLIMTVYSSELEDCLHVVDANKEVEKYLVEQRKKVKIKGKEVTVTSIEDTLTKEEYKTLVDYKDYGNLKKLKEGHTVIITDTLAKRWKKKEGQKITIEGEEFTILEIVKSFENMGENLYISEKSFSDIMDHYDYCDVLIIAKKDAVLEQLKENLQEAVYEVGSAEILTPEEISEVNKESNQVIMNAIIVLAVIIIIVSGIGLCSVVMINILLRQKEFVIYQTIGISKASILKISLFEALAVSVYGIVNALFMQKVLLSAIVEILSYYVGNLEASLEIGKRMPLFLGISGMTIIIMIGVTKKYALTNKLIEKVKIG